jgi:hypothetical protein
VTERDPPTGVGRVFRRGKKPESVPVEVSVSEPAASVPDASGEPAQNAAHYQTKLQDWRRSAEGVTGAWNAWLAAERHELSVCYQAWVLALAEEERAAVELERIADTGDSVTPTPR